MALGRLVLSALVVCSAAVLAEEGTCAAEDGCDEVGLAQLRRAEARVALAVNASSKCSIGCDPHSNPIGRCPDLSDCPASGCCDKPGPTPAPTPSPSPPSGPCKVGCDPHSNPIGRCPDLSDCPASGCCDKPGPTPAPTPGSGCASNYCCWWPQPGQCGSCGTHWSNRVYLPGSNCPGFNERSDAYSGCTSPGTWCR